MQSRKENLIMSSCKKSYLIQIISLGFCFCNDAKEIEVDIRDQALKEVMDLCPRGEMDRCLCKDKTKILWPFTQFEMLACAPKKVNVIVVIWFQIKLYY